MEDVKSPFGINLTKRLVSYFGEEELYKSYSIDDHGEIEFIDYMGGDEIVERVATAGHGRKIFQEKPSQQEFIDYLNAKGIYEPFKSVHLKFSIQAPIETALTLVYEPSVSVNEYSGRYSVMINSSRIPNMQSIINSSENVKKAIEIQEIIKKNREEAFSKYQELVAIDLARELARVGLGIDNDTRFFWKIDLFNLAQFYNKQGKKLDKYNDTMKYIETIASIAKKVAPYSWSALTNEKLNNGLSLSMPNDDVVVDSSLNPPDWEQSETRRVTVATLEAMLFEKRDFLNNGEFQVVDYMGDDSSFAQAARTSYGEGTKTIQDDKNLIRSLIRDLHTSPIEMAELAFEAKVPVFTDPRQAGRHRTLDNHGFMGYMPIGSQYYSIPDSEMKYQDRKNRQGRGKEMDADDILRSRELILSTLENEKQNASRIRELGAPEEIVRLAKGVGFYTKRWRTGDTHNLGHFLRLRLDAHAQKEIRDYAQLVAEAVAAHTPIAFEAVQDYIINGMRLSAKEIQLLNSRIKDGTLTKDTDLSNLDFYRGVGFVLKKKDTEEKELGREGQAFKAKLEKLIS